VTTADHLLSLEDFETIAQEVSALGQRMSALEKRLEHVEQVNAGLEEAALTTARAPAGDLGALGQGL
jgi:uncharacterized protein YlxW (UPF0749 family)